MVEGVGVQECGVEEVGVEEVGVEDCALLKFISVVITEFHGIFVELFREFSKKS